MIEVAIGVTIFLTASLGAVQLGSTALSSEGAQSAALVGARTALGAPIPGVPITKLAEGQAAAAASLGNELLGTARLVSCFNGDTQGGLCGLPQECVQYEGDQPVAGTGQPCPREDSGEDESAALGPAPTNLDGPQNPACDNFDCFGIAQSMAPCSQSVAAGQIVVCLAYTSWPARSVDIWVRGTLRSLVPVISTAGLDALPVSVQLRLQVETLTS
jgi:hypothetical protein